MNEKPGLTASVVEDYLKVVYGHTEWQSEPITPSVLAGKLGLAASTVTEMVKKLKRAGLVTHVPYGAVTLTVEGRVQALRMVRRHRLIETWLVDTFRYGWDEVHDEAEILEHSVSDRLLEAISDQLGDPRRDPHGDPIPRADGSIEQPDAVLLFDARDGSFGPVVRISDRDPELLKYLEGQGVVLDARVSVLERRPFGGALAIRTQSATIDLGDEAARAVWIGTS